MDWFTPKVFYGFILLLLMVIDTEPVRVRVDWLRPNAEFSGSREVDVTDTIESQLKYINLTAANFYARPKMKTHTHTHANGNCQEWIRMQFETLWLNSSEFSSVFSRHNGTLSFAIARRLRISLHSQDVFVQYGFRFYGILSVDFILFANCHWCGFFFFGFFFVTNFILFHFIWFVVYNS